MDSMELCLLSEVLENNVRKVETYSFELSNEINGKNSWVNSNGYVIFWYTGDTNQWILSGVENTFIFTYTTNDIPLSGWQILGSRPPKQIKNIRITTGDCVNNVIVDYSVNIKNSSCKCDGSLIIDTFSGVAPFRYFLNNKKQLGNIIENLCEGKYVVKVVDSEESETTKEVIIPKNKFTQYFVTLNYNKTNGEFSIVCNPELTNNIKLKFDLVYQNVLNYGPEINSVVQNYTEQVYINNIDIGEYKNFSENTQVTNLQRPCIGSNYRIIKIKEWQNLTIESGDTVIGYIMSNISPNIDVKTLCYNGSQDLTLTLKNLQVINCNCCNVTRVVFNK